MFTKLSSAVLATCLAAVNAAVVSQPGVADHVFLSPTAEPTGQNVTLGNVTTYAAFPEGSYDNETAVIVLMDIFGFAKTDNFLLADTWGKAGIATYMPDYLFGDPVPQDGSANMTEWFAKHSEAATTPLLLSVIDALRESGVKKIAATGYCFGGLYATRLTQNNTVEVATMAHPSLLTVPDDYELVAYQSTVPVQIHSAEKDTGLTPELAAQIDEVMVDYEPGYNHTAWAGVGHGFAVSANASDPVAVAAKEGAFNSSLAWITTHLDAC